MSTISIDLAGLALSHLATVSEREECEVAKQQAWMVVPWMNLLPGGMTSSPLGGTSEYQFLHRSINHQVANVGTKNDAYSALSPMFRYVSV
ncbi:hypothetical protein TNCV_1938611 [Trichonephila clavipes]|nr:hypothetical protein TNCV_1938611 [Trichonephila clavipes]